MPSCHHGWLGLRMRPAWKMSALYVGKAFERYQTGRRRLRKMPAWKKKALEDASLKNTELKDTRPVGRKRLGNEK
jgi:hypothetical protein